MPSFLWIEWVLLLGVIQSGAGLLSPRNIYPDVKSSSEIFFEDFDTCVVPPGWTVIDGNGDGLTFIVDSCLCEIDTICCLFYSDDDAGPGSPPTVELAISSPIPIPDDIENLYLSFDWCFLSACGLESVFVQVVCDAGSTTVWSQDQSGCGTDTIDLSQCLGSSWISLIFGYDDGNGCWGFYGGFDDVRLYEYVAPPCCVCPVIDSLGAFPENIVPADIAYDPTRDRFYTVIMGGGRF